MQDSYLQANLLISFCRFSISLLISKSLSINSLVFFGGVIILGSRLLAEGPKLSDYCIYFQKIMAQIFQQLLQWLGVSDSTIKYFFQSQQDRIVNAIMNGDVEQLQQLHEASNYDFSTQVSGENGLMIAVRVNQPIIVRYILQHTERSKVLSLIEDKNQYGDTSLMIATINQNIEIASYLISEGAKVNSRENGGASIFVAACASGNLELVSYLFSVPGVNVYQKNNDGQTALHRACFYGEIEIVRFLLRNTKMSILAKDKMGNNCFHLAARHLNITLIRYMFKKIKNNANKGSSLYTSYQSVLHYENGEKQSTLSILCQLFNLIKDESFPQVDEQQVMDYILNKDMPPDLNNWTRKHREIQKKMMQPNVANQRKRKTLLYRLNLK